MGKGDIKSKRGKIVNGSYGKRRKRKTTKSFVAHPSQITEKETIEIKKKPVEKNETGNENQEKPVKIPKKTTRKKVEKTE